MAENSQIQWTHHTANLWWGCQRVHAGCDHWKLSDLTYLINQ
jgi:protein gp37